MNAATWRGEGAWVEVPVFAMGHEQQTFLRFDAIGIQDRSSPCIADVSRVIDGPSLPLCQRLTSLW